MAYPDKHIGGGMPDYEVKVITGMQTPGPDDVCAAVTDMRWEKTATQRLKTGLCDYNGQKQIFSSVIYV